MPISSLETQAYYQKWRGLNSETHAFDNNISLHNNNYRDLVAILLTIII